MTLAEVILYMMIGTPQERRVLRMQWHRFCEQHLVAEEPKNDDDKNDEGEE